MLSEPFEKTFPRKAQFFERKNSEIAETEKFNKTLSSLKSILNN